MVSKISDVASGVHGNNSQLTTGFNKVKAIDNRSIDRVLMQTQDLIVDPENYKGWFAKMARQLGPDRYLGLASDARRGKNPAKLFSFLLRQETAR